MQHVEDETWAAVPGYAYEVSTHGRVRSHNALKKLTLNARLGYLVVGIWRQNKGRVAYVHDLVAEAFIGPKAQGLCVNHKDADKTNNRVENLEYMTIGENNQHARALGLHAYGERAAHSKLTEAQAIEIKQRALSGQRGCDLAKEFGVSQVAICQIKNGTRWRHLTPTA